LYALVIVCIIVVHNTELNSSDNLSFYPPDNHRSSNHVYWRVGELFDRLVIPKTKTTLIALREHFYSSIHWRRRELS